MQCGVDVGDIFLLDIFVYSKYRLFQVHSRHNYEGSEDPVLFLCSSY